MTQNEIIRMAREAGAMFDHMTWVERDLAPVFERFAALVAAHERKNSAKMQGDCTLAALKLAEEALQRSKRNHYCCEDTWYSCPKAEDGCANDAEGDDCNCGADVLNAENDKALAAIREALAEQSKCACDSPAWCTKYKKCNREMLGLPKAETVKQEPVAHYKDAPHTIYLQTGCDDPEDCECSFNEWGDTT